MSETSENKPLFAEKILAKRDDGKEIKYLIKWHGLSIDKATWKEERYLKNVNSLIEEFERNSVYTNYLHESQDKSSSEDEKGSVKRKKKQSKIKSKDSDSLKKKEVYSDSHKRKKSIEYEKETLKEELKGKIECVDNSQNIVFSPDLTIDIPDKVISAKIYEKSLCCLVTWKLRPNGITPEPSYVLSEFLKDKFPYPLIDFYESKIQFHKKKSGVN